ncbi:MAG: tetratricopeptide repeat protein [Chitinophagaceae bacterium]
MRKLLLTIPAIFLALFSVSAQQAEIDSLITVINKNTKDSSQVDALNRLSVLYSTSRADTALKLAQQSLEIARHSKVPVLEAKSLNATAGVLWAIGDFAQALDYYLQALKIAEDIKDDYMIGKISGNLGNIYAALGDEEKAISYSKINLAIFEKNSYQLGRCKALLNLGDSYENLDMLDSARMCTTLANDLSIKINNRQLEALSLCNLGNIYSKMNQPDIAMSYYRASMRLCKEVSLVTGICEVSLGMAELFKKAGTGDSVQHYAKLSLRVAQDGGFMPDVLKASEFLAGYYKEHRNVDSAFTYMQQMITVKDSLFSEEKSHQVQMLNIKENIRQQQLESQRQLTEQQRKDNIQYAVIGIGVITFLLLFLLLSRSVIINEKWIRFLGILGLLLFFEFINLFLHPFLGDITNHSPVLMLLIMVAIASLLIPLHHKIEHYITYKLTAKNRRIRLAAAQKTIAELEEKPATEHHSPSEK